MTQQGLFSLFSFVHHLRQQMRGGNVPWALQRKVYRSVINGALRFRPQTDRV